VAGGTTETDYFYPILPLARLNMADEAQASWSMEYDQKTAEVCVLGGKVLIGETFGED